MTKQKLQSPIMIGELANLTKVGVEAIRYYEHISLMPRPLRTAGGRRVYDDSSVQTLLFIRRSRQLGFSLDDIRALLKLRASKPCCIDVKTIASRHLEVVRAKLRLLGEMEAALSETIAMCPGDESVDCPVLNVLDSRDSEAASLSP